MVMKTAVSPFVSSLSELDKFMRCLLIINSLVSPRWGMTISFAYIVQYAEDDDATWDSDNYDIVPFYCQEYRKRYHQIPQTATTAYKAYTAYTTHSAYIAYIALTAIGRKTLFNICLRGGGEILYVWVIIQNILSENFTILPRYSKGRKSKHSCWPNHKLFGGWSIIEWMSSRACHYPVLQVVDAQNSRDGARQTQLDNLALPKHSRTGTKILRYKHKHTQKNIICKIILISSEYSDCIENEMFSLRKKIFLRQKILNIEILWHKTHSAYSQNWIIQTNF